jgi:hypothetical protein
MLFEEIIATYSKNHEKPINTSDGQNAGLVIVKAGGTLCFKGLNGTFNY